MVMQQKSRNVGGVGHPWQVGHVSMSDGDQISCYGDVDAYETKKGRKVGK